MWLGVAITSRPDLAFTTKESLICGEIIGWYLPNLHV